MDRLTPTGVPKSDLAYYLQRPDFVRIAIDTDSCLLCRSTAVNEAGLCNLCTSTRCTNEELHLVEQWMAGILRT